MVFNIKANDYRLIALVQYVIVIQDEADHADAKKLLAYIMDQHGLSRTDLVPLLGTASRVSEVLSGRRDLSMTMVRRLRERFHISADLLVPRRRARNRIAA